MKTKIEMKWVYPYPIDSVWKAISDPKALAQWLMDNDFQPKVGHKFRFTSHPRGGWDGITLGEVLEVNSPRKLSYTWENTDGKLKTIVMWELKEVSGGTELSLKHTGFEGIKGFILGKLILGPGWRSMARKKIPKVLEFMKSNGTNFPQGKLTECQHA